MSTPAATAAHGQPLRFLFPSWFAIVMGLAGLALAWHRAGPLMGPAATVAADAIGALAAVVFAVLAVATLLRRQRHPEAWAEDLKHPLRHVFVAAMPVSLILLGFPLAAFTSLTLRLGADGWLAMVGVALLALSSLLAGALLVATARGLRDGRLLAPEPAAMMTAVAPS